MMMALPFSRYRTDARLFFSTGGDNLEMHAVPFISGTF